MKINLGSGWKTITGAAIWGVAHVGLITAAVGLVNPAAAVTAGILLGKVGAALAALGIADKANKAPILNAPA